MSKKPIETVIYPQAAQPISRVDAEENQVVTLVRTPRGIVTIRLRVNKNGAVSLTSEAADAQGKEINLYRGSFDTGRFVVERYMGIQSNTWEEYATANTQHEADNLADAARRGGYSARVLDREGLAVGRCALEGCHNVLATGQAMCEKHQKQYS